MLVISILKMTNLYQISQKLDSEVGYLPMERLKNGYMLPSVINVYNLTQGLTFFKENDIVMAKVTPCFENGNIAIAKNLINNCGFGSSELFIFRVRNINRKYFFYLLQEEKIKEVCKSTMIGTGGLKRISPTFMRNLLLPIPTTLEQQSIATYLEQKCSEIDELITLQEEMITKLQSYKQSVITEAVTKGLDKNVPLKDSGIEWIGEIPEHWKVVKIKYLAKIKSGDSISSNELIQAGIYEVYGGNGLMGYCNKNNVNGFNIIIGRVGALCGNVRLISDSKFITDNALILNCFDNALYPYMYIMLKAANLNNLNTSNAQPLITGSKVLNVSLPIPPLSEQQSIANYLDQKCSEIDELISIKQQKIEKLKDYKKSLIFECVTGKRKV